MVKELIAANVVGIGCVLIGFGYLPQITENYLNNVIEIQSNRFHDIATIHQIHFNEHPSPEKLLSYFTLTSAYVPTIDDNLLTITFDKIEVEGCSFTYNSLNGDVVLSQCAITEETKNTVDTVFSKELNGDL